MTPYKTFFLLNLMLSFYSVDAIASEHPRDRWLTADEIISDINLAEMTYKRAHPGYDRYTHSSDLAQAWQHIRHQATENNGMQLGDFYLATSEVLAMIKCDHTKAELPKILADARETDATYLPFKWRMLEGKILVEFSTVDSGLIKGFQITAIDGIDINERIAQVQKFIPVDGYTDHTKMNLTAASGEHKGGALDHFGALLWPIKPKVVVDYLDLSGKPRQITVKRINYKQWRELSPNQVRNFSDAITFKHLNEQAGYLKIDTFVNYRTPVNPDKLYGPVFKLLKKQQTKYLILDLRNNGGGSNEPPQRLLAHLMPEKFKMFKDVRVKTLNLDGIKEHVFTWEKQALNPRASGFNANSDGSFSFKPNILDDTQWVKPDKKAYTGQLLVLTSHNNSSGSTNLMSALKSRPHTTFIGEATGGSVEGPTAGVLLFLKLPASGITARVPLFRYFNDIQGFNLGMGLLPDVAVKQNVADFLTGTDSTLQAALNITLK